MKILENISLGEYTTFKIGGPARYFCVVRSVDEIREALEFSKTKAVPFFVLGGGSNVLVSDAGFSGLVIKIEMKGATFEPTADGLTALVTAWAGEGWDELVAKTVEWNAWGMENLSLVPGTVGASPVQNIGAYGVEVKDCIESVRTLNSETGQEKVFSNAECQFGYRTSVFKRSAFKKYIIISVAFRLNLQSAPNLSYKDLKEYFAGRGAIAGAAPVGAAEKVSPSQSEIRDAVISIRTGKFPDLTQMGTAGSFWKNPIITREHFEKIKAVHPLIPSFPADGDNVKVPLAWILDAVCNLKGFTLGAPGSSVGLFKKQPLVVVADRGASASAVDHLADYVASAVKEKTGIVIEREVEGL